MEYFILVVSLLILVKGADVLIESTSKLAKKFNVPSFIIGLFIIAIGTSAPEGYDRRFVSFKRNQFAYTWNVIGSNIVNVLVIIGITAIISPLVVDSSVAKIAYRNSCSNCIYNYDSYINYLV